jgi:hypothetical protein
MANGIYGFARQAFLEGSLSWLNDTIKIVLVDTNGASPYFVNLAADRFLSSVPMGARISTSTLTDKSSTSGAASAANAVFSRPTPGVQCEALIVYKDTGTDSTSPLIAYLDSTNVSGLPVTTNGGDVTINWSKGDSKIFKL